MVVVIVNISGKKCYQDICLVSKIDLYFLTIFYILTFHSGACPGPGV